MKMFIFLEDRRERDRRFIKAFVKKEFDKDIPDELFIKTNSWTGIKSEEIERLLQLNDANGDLNLILFDADENPAERLQTIQQYLNNINVQAKIYLFPDNQNTGELETLLMKLANRTDKQFFTDCYYNYLNCIQRGLPNNNQLYRVPDHKDMFQAYCSFFKQGEVDFMNDSFWDFSVEEAEPLKAFLRPYFS